MPLSRRETCRACDADLHVCRLCAHYEPNWSDGCREDRAERVSDPERANFCDYIQPCLREQAPQGAAVQEAQRALADLFGEAPPDTGSASEETDPDSESAEAGPSASDQDAAMEELRRLLGATDDQGSRGDR